MTSAFTVNSDTRRLTEALRRFYGAQEWDAVAEGEGGFLPEEVRWLCVTHKSFDHGRRGFNDRLGFFGSTLSFSFG